MAEQDNKDKKEDEEKADSSEPQEEEENPSQPEAGASPLPQAQGGEPAAADSQPAPKTSRRAGRIGRWLAGPFPYLLVAGASALAVTLALSTRHEVAYREMMDELRQSLTSVERTLAQAKEATTTYVAAPTGEILKDYGNLLNLAAAAENRGDFAEAVGLYHSAVDQDSAYQFSDEAHYRLALCLLRTDRVEEALNELRVVVSRFRGSRYRVRATVELAQQLKEKGDFGQVRRLFYEVIGTRDALPAEDQACVERAYFEIASCFEKEAEVLEASKQSSAAILDLVVAKGSER